ncbi:MAG: hypothetical protein ACK58L_07085 [Planctomycetota bacterium]
MRVQHGLKHCEEHFLVDIRSIVSADFRESTSQNYGPIDIKEMGKSLALRGA